MSDINQWFFIKQLNYDKKFITIIPKFVRNATNHTVFEHKGNLLVYCITNDDNVYVYECIDGQYIQDVNKNYVSEPQKVEELCGKQVIDIKCGINFMIALTKTGRMYSWGWNQCGQLGRENTNEYVNPIIALMELSVVDISCGAAHSIALTCNGQVFEWGCNTVTKEYMRTPVRVIGLRYQTIIAISCGSLHSLVLTENGEVFGWGVNSKGQLGVGNYANINKPIKIDNLNGDKIVKISCGQFHSILLSENGYIYVFGSNKFGQIGDQTNKSKNIPIKLNISTKFIDICAPIFYNQTSIGKSVDGFCYVWGKCNESLITKPTKTNYKNINEVLVKYSRIKRTYKPYYFKKAFENMSPKERFEESFNKSELKFNDIAFKIDGKYIYAQKSYLISVCEHFDTLFSNQWKESTTNVIEITQYSYSIYYSFLHYLYTNSLDIKSKHLIELFYLADSYFEINLKKYCIENMKEVVNINNVINFYAFAVKNNLTELENSMFNYMNTRFKDVIKTKAYIEMNDNSITKRLFETVLMNGTNALSEFN